MPIPCFLLAAAIAAAAPASRVSVAMQTGAAAPGHRAGSMMRDDRAARAERALAMRAIVAPPPLTRGLRRGHVRMQRLATDALATDAMATAPAVALDARGYRSMSWSSLTSLPDSTVTRADRATRVSGL